MPHTFLREAAPQFWRGGVFPGRIGTTSKRHDCLPPWSAEDVLKDAHLQYWRSQADYEAGKAAAMDNPINLRGFEVAVDMSDPKWGFTLTPLEPGQRAWALRAPNEADRLEWARRLVIVTLMNT